MKKFKNIVFGILSLMILVFVTGCGNKNPLTSESFKAKMEEKNYIIVDTISEFTDNDFIEKAYLAMDNSSTHQIEFYQMNTVDDAINFYNNYKKIFESTKTAEAKETNAEAKNYTKYILNTNDAYKVLSRIDNTIIYVDTYNTNKEIIDDVLKDLKY